MRQEIVKVARNVIVTSSYRVITEELSLTSMGMNAARHVSTRVHSVDQFRFREPSQRCKVSLHYRRAERQREREREKDCFGGHAMHRPKKM